MDLFDRIVQVTVVRRPSGFVGSNPQFFETLGNATVIDKLKISFDVTKHLGKEPNKCLIKIWNLSANTRGELDKKPIRVTLQAGYAGVARLLFTGDLTRAFSQREGPDIITTLQVADGMRAYQNGRMNKSYKPPISVQRVLEDAAKSMSLQLPPEIERSAELRQALEDGISMHGPTRDVLTRLLAPYGYSWSIQNGQLQILKDDQVRAGEAFLIDEEHGLLNSPERTTPEKPGGKSEVKFDVQLYPELVPGAQAKLTSEFLDLTMKMTDVQSVGDNRDGDFKTSVTGTPVQ